MQEFFNRFSKDARHYQIAVLFSLSGFLILSSDFAPKMIILFVCIFSTCLAQAIFLRLYQCSVYDFRSPLISSLSLCLLLRAEEWWVYVLAGFAVVASKFILRWQDKHIFNPTNFAIVAGLVLLPDQVWVSPGQWGSSVLLMFFLACSAFFVLFRAKTGDITLFFLGSWAALTFGRALWLGDPLSIPIHQMQSGALLIFAFFMISDPKTVPDHRLGRLVFALMSAGLAFALQFEFQVREGLFYALFIVCLSTPVLDRLFKYERYQWGKI